MVLAGRPAWLILGAGDLQSNALQIPFRFGRERGILVKRADPGLGLSHVGIDQTLTQAS